jgi:hypothetical protein
MRCKKSHSGTMMGFIILLILFILLLGYVIFSRVMEYYSQLDPMLRHIHKKLEPLDPKVKSLKFYEGNKSYTINKKKIYLCLRDEKNEYYNENMLMYVAIHELAHVLCDEIGHTDKFHRIFKQLLYKAQKMGIYDASQPIVRNYCGHH